MNALDTNVFVYALDEDEPVKQSEAVQLVDDLVPLRSDTVLLWQVAGELLACRRRWADQGRLTPGDVDSHIHDVLALFPIAVPTPKVIDASLTLAARYSLSHWDSMLLGACVEAGVDTLYSEDFSSGTNYDSVLVVNPFV